MISSRQGETGPGGERVAVVAMDPRQPSGFQASSIWLVQGDADGLRPVRNTTGKLAGWTYDGDLLIWNQGTDDSIVRLNPDTKATRAIFRPPHP